MPAQGLQGKSLRILITGAGGMLGRALHRMLGSRHTLVRTSRTAEEGIEQADLTDPEAVTGLFTAGGYDCVIHTAAYSDVDGCERDPEAARRVNVLATRHLAACCAASGSPLAHISTDYVFSGEKEGSYVETDPTYPVNIYGLTKLEAEYHVLRCATPSAVIRTSWLYGGEKSGDFVNAVVERLRKTGAVGVLDDQTGCPTSVTDLSLALEAVAERLAALRSTGGAYSEVFHICNAGATTRHAMTLKIRDLLGLPSATVERRTKQDISGRVAVRPRCNVMSTDKFQADFAMRPRSWEEGLRDYLAEIPCVS